jgi:Trypsin
MTTHHRHHQSRWAALVAALLLSVWTAPGSPASGPDPQVTEAPISDSPGFAVRLIFLDPEVEFTDCTGVVLSRHWVVTAAHCVRFMVAQYGVYAPDRLTIRYGADGTDGRAESYTRGDASYYIHPDYSGDDDDLGDDFALVRLYGDGMSAYTRARIMAETSDCFFNGGDIESVWIAGYGLGTDPGDGGDCPSSGSGYKRSGAFAFLPNCGAIPFHGWSPGAPFVRELVVDSGSRIACAGDSGGPIYARYNGRDVVAGLFAGSRFDPFGSDTQRGPSIRRRLDWILETSVTSGLPLECTPFITDVGPDYWSCRD